MSEAETATAPASVADLGDLTQSAVVVRVGQVEFGIRVKLVREVLHVPTITRLPFPPPSVPGVVSVRGSVLPVVDLGDRLFGQPSSRKGRIVLVTDPGSGTDLALLVDEVVDLVSLEERIEDPPEEIASSLPEGWIEAVVSPRPDRLVTLLELGPVLARHDDPDEES
jgi:purine-binding chemotaxis protein CheW